MKLSIDQWKNYLMRKTGGFNCPICGENKWQTQQDPDGGVKIQHVMEETAFNNQVGELIIEQGGNLPKEEAPSVESHVQNSILIRCGHCGWMALFDAEFVMENIDEKE